MSRFSAGVAPRTSTTWSNQLLPKIVTTGVSAATSSCRFGSVSGRLERCRVMPKAASLARSQRIPRAAAKNSMSLGFEPGQPPSMKGIPYSSSIRATRSLSARDRVMFSPWVPSRSVVSYRTTGWSGAVVTP